MSHSWGTLGPSIFKKIPRQVLLPRVLLPSLLFILDKGRDEKTIYSSHVVILFGGVIFFMPFPVMEMSYFQGISAWVFFFFSVSGA